MTQLTKRKRNGNSGRLPLLRNDLFLNSFFAPATLLDIEDVFFNGGIVSPPANIIETDNEFKVDFSVPGMKREDFKVDVDNGCLTISSEKKEEEENEEKENKNYRRREFSYSSFSRTFSLPDNVDENNINAKYDNGVLEVTIPKKEVKLSKPKKQIQVT